MAVSLAKVAIESKYDAKGLETVTGRDALVLAAKNYCDEIRRIFPQNSPSEEQWLQEEIKGSYERMMRAYHSAEWGRLETKQFTEGCGTWTAAFRNDPDQPKNFVGLEYVFLRFSGDSELHARKNGFNPDELGMPITLRATSEALLMAALLADK